MTSRLALLLSGVLAAGLCLGFLAQDKREGYTDTPILPGQKWRVHDAARPYPGEVIPSVVHGAPPSDAVVLFGGADLSHWMQSGKGADRGKQVAPKWTVRDGYVEVAGGTGSLISREKFGDCQLHIEWQESVDIQGTSQNRGNGGVFLMGRYEIQILDSYRARTYADGQAGAIYGQWPPMVNPMRKPGEWQTFDVIFEAPQFDGEKLVSPAYMTVLFNGVLVHHHQKLNGPTNHGVVLPYLKHNSEESIYLQDHNPAQPLRFRNIWIRKLAGYDLPETGEK